MIDDNPYICRSIAENIPNVNVVAPYPAVAEQHHRDVILIETSVSDLKKEDFDKN
jgi:hypothetical protein